MLATANWGFLKMAVRRGTYRWRQPKIKNRRHPSWYRRRNLIIVWDLVQKDFRIVSLDDWDIIAYYPINSAVTQAKFTMFYRKRLTKMNRSQKDSYSDR
jgi:hypothetical protein